MDATAPVKVGDMVVRRLNSSARIIRDLNHRCLRIRVRPYYLHQGDVAQGLDHLRTPIAKGIEIIEALRGHTSGLAVPHLAVDLPDGGGKVTLQPNYLVSQAEDSTLFRNYKGEMYSYPEPVERDCSVPYDDVYYGGESAPAPARRALSVVRG